jgi:hypothetical protein
MKLSYKQLAFILDIEPIEALKKIIYVHCKVRGIALPYSQEKVKDYLYPGSVLPDELDVGLLALHLNLPTLQQSVEDIKNNFLKRPATKKWILCDYPEKELKTKEKHKVKIPPVLVSLLNKEDLNTISKEWSRRFSIKV